MRLMRGQVPWRKRLPVRHVKRMSRMPCFRQSEVTQADTMFAKEFSNFEAALKMHAMHAPCGNDGVRIPRVFDQQAVIFGSDRLCSLAHFHGVRVAPCENICHAKRTESQLTRAALAPFDGGIIFHCIGHGRVKHDKVHPTRVSVPLSDQRVSISAAPRVIRFGRFAVFGMPLDLHDGPRASIKTEVQRKTAPDVRAVSQVLRIRVSRGQLHV